MGGEMLIDVVFNIIELNILGFGRSALVSELIFFSDQCVMFNITHKQLIHSKCKIEQWLLNDYEKLIDIVSDSTQQLTF